ncbi:MAG: DUF5719 family protein [Candidatus Dormibacteraceae bacterium]
MRARRVGGRPRLVTLSAAPLAVLSAALLAAAASGAVPQPARAATSPVLYFAEGTTRPGFLEYLTLENAGAAPTPITATYYYGGTAKRVNMTLAAHTRTTVKVNDVIGSGYDVSIAIDTGGDADVHAERPMYFNACLKAPTVCVNGGDVASSALPGKDWYFAEGYTAAGFQEYLSIFNPTSTPANVNFEYYHPDGTVRSGRPLQVPALTRSTVDVNLAEGGGHEVSTWLSSDQPIVAERPEYFNACLAPGLCANGGSDAVGAQPQTGWNFAEGYTAPGYQEYLLLLNPGSTDTVATVDYMFSDGRRQRVPHPVPAHSRVTVNVNGDVGEGHEVSAQVTSLAGQPVVAERAMYFQTTSPFWVKGGNATAGFAPAVSWNFAEGYTGAGFQEYLTLENPNTAPADVNLTIMDAAGNTSTTSTTVVPTSRQTIDVNRILQGGREVSISLKSTNGQPIVAERPMYYTGCISSGVCVNLPPPPPPVQLGDGHRIVISLSRQHLWAYDHGRLLLQTDVTTGRPVLPTPAGDYHIFDKESPYQFISPWPVWSPFYYNPAWVNYAMQFIPGGYYLHDAPWRTWYGPGSNFGDGTHGCVNIPLAPMTRLFLWARIGDEVVVQG